MWFGLREPDVQRLAHAFDDLAGKERVEIWRSALLLADDHHRLLNLVALLGRELLEAHEGHRDVRLSLRAQLRDEVDAEVVGVIAGNLGIERGVVIVYVVEHRAANPRTYLLERTPAGQPVIG